MKDKNAHTEHCCVKHGCKYNDENCPVISEVQTQSYYCEFCEYENSLTGVFDGFPREAS